MITLTLIGAAIGACLFWLLYKLVPPKRSPLVELAQFDAYRLGSAVHQTVTEDPAARTKVAADVQGRVGHWFAAELQRRGIRYVTGQVVEGSQGWPSANVVRAGKNPR